MLPLSLSLCMCVGISTMLAIERSIQAESARNFIAFGFFNLDCRAWNVMRPENQKYLNYPFTRKKQRKIHLNRIKCVTLTQVNQEIKAIIPSRHWKLNSNGTCAAIAHERAFIFLLLLFTFLFWPLHQRAIKEIFLVLFTFHSHLICYRCRFDSVFDAQKCRFFTCEQSLLRLFYDYCTVILSCFACILSRMCAALWPFRCNIKTFATQMKAHSNKTIADKMTSNKIICKRKSSENWYCIVVTDAEYVQ